MREFDVAVLGAGAVGLTAALQFARSGRTVVIVSNRLPGPGGARRVDAVPASFLALLVELGINPVEIGADRLQRARVSAWQSAAPQVSDASSAHVERPALDMALLQAAKRAGCVVRSRFEVEAEGAGGRDWKAKRFVDATGRAAVTAVRRIRAPKPWVARIFWAPVSTHDRGFAIAQLSEGYAYRLGAASTLVFGVVGRRAAVAGSFHDIAQRLRTHAPWMLENLPAFAALQSGGACAASVQWSEGSGLRIGDAALARDALSSQGLATGASEALQACAMGGEDDRVLIVARQREQQQSHLRSLSAVLESGRFSDAPTWREYIDFVRSELDPEIAEWTSAVQRDRIQRVYLRGIP
jgi:2-polyprenyl-6-methoxyphenol hydroxylase-like FAD-dependent oxidoreductase